MLDTNTVRNPDARLCETLAGLAAHHWRTWCYPSQEKLRELLQRFTGRRMSRRTLNRHLAGLERDGHIRRIRRHVRDKRLGLILRSTVYVIAGRYLARVQRLVAAAARWAKLASGFNPPQPVPIPAQHGNPLSERSLRRRL